MPARCFRNPGSFGFFNALPILAESPTSFAIIVDASDDSSLSVEDTDSLSISVGAITDLASMVCNKDGLQRAIEASDFGVSKVLFSPVVNPLPDPVPRTARSGIREMNAR